MDAVTLSDPDPRVRPGERVRAFRAVEAVLRLQRILRDYFPNEDMESVTVFLTVAAGSISVVNRNAEAHEILARQPLPAEWFRPISGRAVAASCSLPRETVRRRLEHLVEVGRIEKVEGGYTLSENILAQGDNLAFVRALVREFEGVARIVERCDQAS